MKSNRIISFSVICLLLLAAIIFVISDNELVLFNSTDGIVLAKTKNSDVKIDKNRELTKELNDIGSGITDGINTKAISTLATDIDRFVVFDGMTLEELANKLNKSLNGILANKGLMISKRCLELGINPYMAVAIMLHETGCNYGCSSLARNSYNFGGMKGGSGYLKFSSVEAGLNAFLDNLYYNYYKHGLNTPEKINPKYAASTTWASKIRSYMLTIRAK